MIRPTALFTVLALVACGPSKPARDPAVAKSHDSFVRGCVGESEDAEEFCECAWDEVRKDFTDEELASGEPDPERVDVSVKRATKACRGKMPESIVQAGYMKGCMGQDEEMGAFCSCTYKGMREHFSAPQLGDPALVKTKPFKQANLQVTKSCIDHYPEARMRAHFMKTCAANPQNKSFCACAWDALTQQVTPAELAAEEYDHDEVFGTIEKTCGKLRSQG